MDYIVYTEILGGEEIERWYYGTYSHSEANRVASQLGGEYPTYHCVCKASEAEALEIKNLP